MGRKTRKKNQEKNGPGGILNCRTDMHSRAGCMFRDRYLIQCCAVSSRTMRYWDSAREGIMYEYVNFSERYEHWALLSMDRNHIASSLLWTRQIWYHRFESLHTKIYRTLETLIFPPAVSPFFASVGWNQFNELSKHSIPFPTLILRILIIRSQY